MANKIVLCIGDVIGINGRTSLKNHLNELKAEFDVDFTIANGENSANGIGITRNTAAELFASGVDVLTTGNHVWHNKDVFALIGGEGRVLRPYNYPDNTIGLGYNIYNSFGCNIAVINLMGRVYMEPLDCPFKKVLKAIGHIKDKTNIIIVDMHAEATAEKISMGHHLNGEVSLMFGTHTHVQTADEKILSGGTAYITDVGMCGAYDSVIGTKKEAALARFITRIPHRFEVATSAPMINAIVVEIDESSGRALSIKRINRVYDDIIPVQEKQR